MPLSPPSPSFHKTIHSHRLLIICGPTATGKTDLALHLASHFPSILISADSRQVYQGMDIGTGKDLPPEAVWYSGNSPKVEEPFGYYEISGTRLYGYDLVRPDQVFTLAHFLHFARLIITQAWSQNLLPIVVGGTGFYHQSLTSPPETLHTPPDPSLRSSLNNLSVPDLQNKLKKSDPIKFSSLNRSDLHNPRRLIRAIEVTYTDSTPSPDQPALPSALTLKIGLNLSRPLLNHRIESRVKARATSAFTTEVKKLITTYPDWTSPAFSATGYREWRNYLEGQITRQEAIDLWSARERQYARRQLTWFHRDHNIRWLNPLWSGAKASVVELVKTWYAN